MVRRVAILFLLLAPTFLTALALLFSPLLWWGFIAVAPLSLLIIHDLTQSKHSLLRIDPVIGLGRYLLEAVRPEIQQYFVETNTNGAPFNREIRSVIYQRAKGVLDTVPFGTQTDVNEPGYEWMNHSLAPKEIPEEEHRIKVGGPQCTKPYESSHLNISAMSFGSLSRNAIESLNIGARDGGFAHNTGEGGISSYHKKGGDLIWQIGTGYFGCRNRHGGFDEEAFSEQAALDAVKMIEIKLSQGAKPGHGGILPGAKVTEEIASIRRVEIGKTVQSPPTHQTFSDPRGLLEFVATLRELSKGKPIGFKMCIGYKWEFLAICKAMVETKIYPDFITVDGGEGGTGAAPLELSNFAGMPLRDGLVFVHSALRGVGLRQHIRIIASGKIGTGFHMFRAMALGADICASARGMMFALGCIQARRCNDNECPVGVATQDPARFVGLSVKAKSPRVEHYHRETVRSLLELVASAGLEKPEQVEPRHVTRRIGGLLTHGYDHLFPFLGDSELLGDDIPPEWQESWSQASADRF